MATVSAEFRKFHQFAKMEESEDGTPTVWGVATWEQPDSDNERCDYESAKPVYQAWSAKAFKRTKGAGQEPSLGNIRLQHGSDVGGKATKVHFDDAAKEVWLGSEPINNDVHQALKKGFYTGYSQGGSYAWRECDKCETPLPLQQGNNYCPECDAYVTVRYGLKRIAEVSYVDSPATGEGFEHVKFNGSREIVKFAKKEIPVTKEKKTKRVAGEDLESSAFAYVGDPEKTATWKLPIKFSDDARTKSHIRNAFARFEQTKGIPADKKDEVKAKILAAAKEHGIDVEAESDKAAKEAVKTRDMIKAAIDARAESSGLTKGLYAVGRAADILESLACMWEQSVWEREIEGDDSEVPDELKDLLDSFIDTFIAMATEEAKELAAKKSLQPGDHTMTPEELELQKAAKKSAASHFAKAASHHEKMADENEALADHHEGLMDAHKAAGEGCKDCLGKAEAAKAAKLAKADTDPSDDEGDTGIHEVLANQVTFHKAAEKEHKGLAAKHDKIAKMHDKFAEHLHKCAKESDSEEADKAIKEIAAFDAANPEAVVEKEAPKVIPTVDDEVSKAAEIQRNTPEYKAAIAAIAKAKVDAEVASIREKTIAPTGTPIGDALKTGFKVVPRTEETETLAVRSNKSTIAGM
jgi:uncharacterized Zn finger protein (UPF0148 family)